MRGAVFPRPSAAFFLSLLFLCLTAREIPTHAPGVSRYCARDLRRKQQLRISTRLVSQHLRERRGDERQRLRSYEKRSNARFSQFPTISCSLASSLSLSSLSLSFARSLSGCAPIICARARIAAFPRAGVAIYSYETCPVAIPANVLPFITFRIHAHCNNSHSSPSLFPLRPYYVFSFSLILKR